MEIYTLGIGSDIVWDRLFPINKEVLLSLNLRLISFFKDFFAPTVGLKYLF